jgi:hypothetical protein
MSRIDGREPGAVMLEETVDRGAGPSVRLHASTQPSAAVSPTAQRRQEVGISRFYKPHGEAVATLQAGDAREWTTIGGFFVGTRD